MMRTRRNRGGAWPLAVARFFVGALALSLAQPSEAAAQDKCAPYLSGGPDHPASARLVGSRAATVSVSIWFGWSIPVSFNVGTYEMHDGDRIHVRCDLQ